MMPLVPARLFESRSGQTTADGQQQGVGRLAAESVTELAVAGRGGVAADAAAVVLNVTAVSPSAGGWLTVYPCGTPQPQASNVNYAAGAVVPNAVVAKVGDGGKVCVYSKAATDMVVDVNAWFPPGNIPVVLPTATVAIGAPRTTARGR